MPRFVGIPVVIVSFVVDFADICLIFDDLYLNLQPIGVTDSKSVILLIIKRI